MSVLAVLTATPGCSCAATHERPPDAGPALDASVAGDAPDARDAPPTGGDAPIDRDAPPRPLGSLGAPCDAGACDAGLSCGTGVVLTILELDGGTREEVIGAGTCTRRCSPEMPVACDAETACVASVFFGTGRVSLLDASGQGFCLPRVDAALWLPLGPPGPWRPPVPCRSEPAGPVVRAECALPCHTDADCFYVPVSARPAVFREVSEIAPTSALECDRSEGACRHWSASGELGSACTSDLDCRAEHVCWGGPDWATPGVCVVPTCEGCEGPGVECVELEPGARGCARTAP